MTALFKFLLPYVSALYGAASNIEQSLDGLGLVSSNFVKRNAQGIITESYWSPAEVAQSILGYLILFVFLLFLLWAVAGYVVGRKKGIAIAILIAILPGVLSVAGAWPNLSFMPETFVIGGNGVLGSGWGMLPLLCLSMVTGWTCTIILCDLLNLGDHFWHVYDHFWVATAIFAGIFFVADSNVGENSRRLSESSRTFQQASAYLLNQVETYSTWCAQNASPRSESCQWTSDVHQLLIDYSTHEAVINVEFGPKSIADVYLPFNRQADTDRIDRIRRELAAYNNKLCPTKELGNGMRLHARRSTVCQQPPATFCNAYPNPLDGVIDRDAMNKTSAIANECLIPTLINLRTQEEKLIKNAKADSTAKHYRWIFYIALAFVAGGKIAGSTAKMASFNQRDKSNRRRSVKLLWSICVRVWKALKFFLGFVLQTLRASLSAFSRIPLKLRTKQ